MFKTNKESIQKLSFGFDERDIANLARLLKFLRSNELLTLTEQEIQREVSRRFHKGPPEIPGDR